MANTSILAAFERMWQHVTAALGNKSDSDHTHDDLATIESVNTGLSNKVDKVSGKGLSTNDFTTAEKTKLSGIAEGANNYSHPETHPATMITGLANVATSGSYNDLSDKPSIPSISGLATTSELTSHTGNTTVHITAAERTAWNAKSNFSGNYNDLTNKPTIPAAYSHPSSHPASMITGLATVATSGSYNDLSDKPSIPSISGLATTSYVNSQDTATLQAAKTYADEKAASLLNNSSDAVDSIMELAAAMEDNADVVEALNEAVGKKVDKVDGKGLSTNDFTTAEKTKLSGIAEGANKYEHPSSHPATMITGLAAVATSGSYNDLANKPTIPSISGLATTSALSSHTGDTTVHITAAERTAWNAKSNFSGNYNDLTNKPTIPAAVTVDSAMSSTSTNPVQNKVVNKAITDLSTANIDCGIW